MNRVLPYVAFAALGLAVLAATCGCDKPADGPAFWWNWGVSALAALGTLLAVGVALFIDKLRALIAAPHLELKIRSPLGILGDIRLVGQENRPGTPSRWYHLRVTNDNRRVASAHGVRVMLTQIWLRESGKAPHLVWDEEVPMVWTHHNEAERTIGAHADADLCSLAQGEEAVRIESRISPFSMPRYVQRNKTVIVCFQARGHEVDSERFCVEIAWTGGWEDDETRMADNLKVRPVSDPARR